MNRNGIYKKCKGCDEIIYSTPSSGKNFCSLLCTRKYQGLQNKKFVVMSCKYCCSTVMVKPSYITKGKKYCNSECYHKASLGKKHDWGYKISAKLKGKKKSPEHAKKVGLKHKGVPKLCMRGVLHPNWTGGRDSISQRVRKCLENKKWKIKCFKRDKVCTNCGESNGKLLQVDHIIPFSYILKVNEINSLKKARKCKLLWDISNGRVLCKSCHKKTDTYGEKAMKYSTKNVDLC